VEYLPLPFEVMFPLLSEGCVGGVAESESAPDDVFWLPACSDVWPVYDITQLDAQGKVTVELLRPEQRRALKCLVHTLHSTLHTLRRVKLSALDCYALGPTAELIGHELLALIDNANSSSSFGSVLSSSSLDTAENVATSASLLLLDRTLDLVPLCLQGLDNVLDTLSFFSASVSASSSLSSLSPYMPCVRDLLATPPFPLPSLRAAMPRVSFSPSTLSVPLLFALVYKRPKDVLQEVRKLLSEVMQTVEGAGSLAPSASLSALCAAYRHLTAAYPTVVYKHTTTWQLIAAALYALLKRDTDETLLHFQHSLRLLLTRDATATATPVSRLLEHCHHILESERLSPSNTSTTFSLANFLMLFTLAASLADSAWSRDDIKAAKSFLVQWILRHPQRDALSVRLLEPVQALLTMHLTSEARQDTDSSMPSEQSPWHSRESRETTTDKVATQQLRLALEDLVELWIDRLSQLSRLRSTLQDYRSLYRNVPHSKSMQTYVPLVRRVMEHILLERGGSDLRDLKKLSTSLKGLLKTGFSRLGLQAKPRPTDNKLIILFVIGGLTCGELRDIKESLTDFYTLAHHNTQYRFLVGTTQFAPTPRHLLDHIYQQNEFPSPP
jgi:hypothetical protein